MDFHNQEMLDRVWQRVQSGRPAPIPADPLKSMLLEEWQDAAMYTYLAGKFRGRHRQTLLQMAQQEKEHLACLKGICAMSTGSCPQVPIQRPRREPVPTMLQQCYGRELQCLACYEARQSDPQYGRIFTQLSQQERLHCQKLLTLMGSLRDYSP